MHGLDSLHDGATFKLGDYCRSFRTKEEEGDYFRRMFPNISDDRIQYLECPLLRAMLYLADIDIEKYLIFSTWRKKE